MDVRTVSQPLGTGERYDVADLALGLGWGRPITDRFAIGAQASWIQERIWNSSMSAVVFHLGTLYKVSDGGVELGASLSNLGVGGQFDGRDLRVTFDQDPDQNGDNSALPAEMFTEGHSVPVLLRFGVGIPVRLDATNRLRFAVDALHPSDNSESLNLGAEYGFKQLFAFRAGWQHLLKEDAEGGLTLGAGLRGDMNNRSATASTTPSPTSAGWKARIASPWVSSSDRAAEDTMDHATRIRRPPANDSRALRPCLALALPGLGAGARPRPRSPRTPRRCSTRSSTPASSTSGTRRTRPTG